MNCPSMQRLSALLPVMTVAVVILVCLSHLYFVDGVRGTDQYWYLSDVATLIDGKSPVTNTVFVGDLLRLGSPNHETYFAHNSPLLSIYAVVGEVLGAEGAWKWGNLFFLLVAAGLTALTVAHISNRCAGYSTAIIFLLTPINIWLAGNFLQEMFFCFLSALILYCSVVESGGMIKRVLLLGAIAVGVLCHPLFVIVGIALTCYWVVWRRKWLMPLLVLVLIVLASRYKSLWFPTSFPPSILDVVAASVPRVSNMIWQLSDSVPEITIDLLVNKLLHALDVQFVPSKSSVVYLVSNVGLVALLYLLFTQLRGKMCLFLYLSVVFMLSYAGIVALMQNQSRYQLFVTPVAVACLVLWLQSWKREHLRWVSVAILLVAYLAVDVLMWNRIRTESRSERKELAALVDILPTLGPDARVAMVGGSVGSWLPIIYAIKPTRAMPVLPKLLQPGQMGKVIRQFEPDYVLVRSNMDMGEVPEAKFLFSIEGSIPFGLDVYQLIGLHK